MAKYSDIKGFTVQTLSTDTAASAAAGGSWASGGDLNTARGQVVGFGTTPAAGAAMGTTGSVVTNYEQYNGTSWTETTDINTAGRNGLGTGTTTAGLIYGGWPRAGKTESWNGSAWTEVGDMTRGANGSQSQAGGGTQTAAFGAGGEPGTTYSQLAEIWNGSAWTEVNDLNTLRQAAQGFGITTAGYVAAGYSPPVGSPYTTANVEVYNGSSWTETTNVNSKRGQGGGAGNAAAGIIYGGTTGSASALTESWDGSAWTEIADMSTARYQFGKTVNPSSGSTDALAIGGEVPSYVATTEEWDAPSVFSQITEGQLYFNSTTNSFKETITDIPGGAWASNASMNTARDNTSGTGHTKDAIIIMGGRGPSSNIANCEQYNGSAWTEVADITARRTAAASGTSTASLCFGGTTSYPSAGPGQSALTESFDGSSWTEVGDLNSARWRISGSPAGTQTAALCTGGREPPVSAKTEVYDGSSWTEVGDLNVARAGATSIGTSTANIFAGGELASGPDSVNTESWDGTSWTEVNNLPVAAKENGGTGGTSTLGFLAGVGGGGSPTSECDFWNGTSWSEMAELGTGRPAGGGGGTAVGATIAGGNPFSAVSESFTAPLANKTITSS